MISLAPATRMNAVASDATVRPVQRRRAGARPATDLAARAPEAAVSTTSGFQLAELRTPPRTRAQPIGTRASAGKGDTPANTNGLCPHGIRRAPRTLLLPPLGKRVAIGSSTAGHGVMPAVERPPRSSRTSAPLQAYKRGRCSTTLIPGTSARGAFAPVHCCWFPALHRCKSGVAPSPPRQPLRGGRRPQHAGSSPAGRPTGALRP